MIDTKKYIFTFVITSAIFATAFFTSTFFSNKRIESVKSIQDNIAIDILSSETQFSLLGEVPCSNVGESSLSPELSTLGDKLSRTEADRGTEDKDVIYLKKYYSLLQIKDYLLSKKLANKCGIAKKPIFIIYFYSNQGDCPDCEKEGYVLTRLREILVIEDKTYIGFKTVEELEKLLPDTLKVATTTVSKKAIIKQNTPKVIVNGTTTVATTTKVVN